MILSIVNTVLILIILIVLIVQIYKDNKQQEDIDKLEKQVRYLKKYRTHDKKYSDKRFRDFKKQIVKAKKNDAVSLLDLREFEHINPTIKEFYKKYFTDQIMQSLVRHFNKNVKANNLDVFLKKNEHLIADYVESIVKEIDHLPVEKLKHLEENPDSLLLLLSSFSPQKEEEIDEKHKNLDYEIRKYT